MIIPTFATFLALFISLFTLAAGLPAISSESSASSITARSPLDIPRSLLGHRYLHRSAADPSARVVPPVAQSEIAGRAARFQEVQRRKSLLRARGSDELDSENVNFLSDQTMVPPPKTTPNPLPAPPVSAPPQIPIASAVPNTHRPTRVRVGKFGGGRKGAPSPNHVVNE